MTVTQFLAELALDSLPAALPRELEIALKRSILDLWGAAAAGFQSDSARALRRAMSNNFGSGKATIWFSGVKTTPAAAAFFNAAAASAMDLDDGNRGAAGHPGASIIPAVFSVVEERDADAVEALKAIAVGYEIACRVGQGRDFRRLSTLSTGRWCAYGAAAATGRLRKVSPEVFAQALAIAGSQSPDLSASGYSLVMGNSVKEGIPWATMLGIMAVDMAECGFTGPTDILDHPDYFDAQKITFPLDRLWEVERSYFKPYSSCRWSHAAIDALLSIFRENTLPPSLVQRVTVETFDRALRLNNYPDPSTLESAQYSIPFCLGVAACKGADALLPMGTNLLHQEDIVNFAGRVELKTDEKLTALFPDKTAARVTVDAGNATFEKTVLDPLGDPLNPMPQDALERKFCRLTNGFMSDVQQKRVIKSVMEVEMHSFSSLMKLLSLND